jgi:hypothetical protein
VVLAVPKLGQGPGAVLGDAVGRLRNYVKPLAEVSPWVSLGLSTVLLYVATYGTLVGWVYTTSGRVTYQARFFQGYEGLFLLIATLLSIYSTAASLGFSRLRVAVSAVYVALAVLTYVTRPQLLYIPYVALLVTLLVVHRGRVVRNLAYGLALAVAVVEFPALVYRAAKFAGLRPDPLEPAHLFSTYLNSSLWYSSLVASVAVLLAPLARSRLRRSPNPGVGVGDEVYLALALLVALVVGLAGYSPAVNPRRVPIDVDWVHYYRWLNTMMGSADPVATAVEVAGDRAAFLILLYGVARLLKLDLLNLCVYMEVVLLQLYTLASYYLAREYFGSGVARYAALLAPLTPHALSFLYGGFQANLFSLTLTYLALGLSAKPRLRRLPLVLVLSVLASLTHAWAWLQFAALVATYLVASVALGVLRRRRPGDYLALTPYLTFVAASTVAYLALRTHIRSRALDHFERGVGLLWTTVTTRSPNPGLLWRNAEFYYNVYTGGSLTSYIYWPLLLVGSLVTEVHSAPYAVALLPLAAALAMYSYTAHSSLLAYRVAINLPTHLVVAKLFEGVPRGARVALYISLLSLALGRVLSIVPRV